MGRGAIIGGLLACLLAAAPAHAGEVGVDGDALRFVADEGEANAARVDRLPRRLVFACALICTGEDVRPPVVLVRDEGAPLRAGEGCVQAGPAAATCTLPRDHIDVNVIAELGDGDDTASANGPFRWVADGGLGADELHGHDGVDGGATLLGGPGGDLLVGGASADLADGGPGDDRIELREEPAMPDEAACGRGEDVVVLGRWDVLVDDRCETVEPDPAA